MSDYNKEKNDGVNYNNNQNNDENDLNRGGYINNGSTQSNAAGNQDFEPYSDNLKEHYYENSTQHLTDYDREYWKQQQQNKQEEFTYRTEYVHQQQTHNKEQSKPKKPESRISLSKRALGGIIAACMIFALLCGFGGGMLSQNISSGKGGTTTDGSKVIYQAVETNFTGSANGEGSLSVADIADLAANSVVEITTEQVSTSNRMMQYISEGAGSGVIITANGYIVTNNHVIEDASKITVTLKDGTKYDATLVGTDSKTDLAVIKIEAANLQPAIYGDSDTLKVGETAVAIGNPLGQLGGTVTDGIISSLDREISIDGETMHLLQTNAAINPGNSGGGLFDSKGQLIGIVNAKSSGTDIEGLGFAIPINIAKPVIESLMNQGYVSGRVELGMTVLEVTNAQTAMMYRVSQLGVYVLKVNEGSAAQKAGFKEGDYIVSLDGSAVSNNSDFKAVIDKHTVGDVLPVTILRDGQQMELNLTLGEYKPS